MTGEPLVKINMPLRLMFMVLLLCLFSLSVSAKETEFEFYYQRIEKVVQINNPEPKGWWETAKSIVKSGVNLAKKTWEKAITRNFNPGEGTKRWYSDKDKNMAYDVSRVKVTSEKHLFELMGAKSENELTDGQKALLAVYRHSKSQAVKDRMAYSYRSSINVILSDTTGFDSPAAYPNVEQDFWPYSSGMTIQMSSGRYNWPGSEDSAKSTFVHEFSHSMDRTIKEIINPYGKDGSHFGNELTKPRTAFVEGWAEFNEMLDSESKARSIKNNIGVIKIEDKKKAGTYTNVEPETLSGDDLLSVEGINAVIMYRIAKESENGRKKIFDAFTSSRWKLFRSLKTITLELAKKNPSDIALIGKIIDEQTLGKLSDTEMMKFIGESDEAKAYLQSRVEAQATEENAADNSGVSATTNGSPLDIEVKTESSNPFSVK